VKTFALIGLLLMTSSSAGLAALPSPQQDSAGGPVSWNVSCHMVRAYVKQLGWARARAVALAAGMTPAQER
jgi:hypothetical protein